MDEERKMNIYEKFGLLIVIAFYTNVFPESWNGKEIVILYVGGTLFLLGKYIEEFETAFKTV